MSSSTTFPMVSVRNPWGFLIHKQLKKVENRKKNLSKEFLNTWIALHVSRTFASTEEGYCHKYLTKHKEFLETDNETDPSKLKRQQSLNAMWGSKFKLTDKMKIGNLIRCELEPQIGHIIAFIKISQCHPISNYAKQFDSIYTDQPFQADSHWIISEVIPFKRNEYIPARGHMGCAKISDKKVNEKLYDLLMKKYAEQDDETKSNKKINEELNKKIKDEIDTKTECAEDEIIEDGDDEDILELLDELDNGTQFTQMPQTDDIEPIESFSENYNMNNDQQQTQLILRSPRANKIGNKRKRNQIVDSMDEDEDGGYDNDTFDFDDIGSFSPPMKKMKTHQTMNDGHPNFTPNTRKLKKLTMTPVQLRSANNVNKSSSIKRRRQTQLKYESNDIDNGIQLESASASKLKSSRNQNKSKSKRRLPGFVHGEHRTVAPTRLGWMNNNGDMHSNHNGKQIPNGNNGKYQKISKKNSILKRKENQNKLRSRLLKPNPEVDMNLDADIEQEIAAALKKREEEEARDIAQRKEKLEVEIQQRMNSNPNEIKRKEKLKLPDQYKHRVIVFDTETATFKPEGVIIEIGAIELINGKITGRKFQAYIKPWAKMHNKAFETHGKSEYWLNKNADGDIYQIIQSFLEWIHSDCICNQCKNLKSHEKEKRKHRLKLVAHNSAFDVRHLNGAINHCQSRMNSNHKIWKPIDVNQTFDTLVYFRDNYQCSSYSLDAMCMKFGIDNKKRERTHGALEDAKVTAQCLQVMWERNQDVLDRKCRNRFFTKRL